MYRRRGWSFRQRYVLPKRRLSRRVSRLRKPYRYRRINTRRQLSRGSKYFTRLTYTTTVTASNNSTPISITDPGFVPTLLSGFNTLATQWQEYKIWKINCTITTLINEANRAADTGMHVIAVYRQTNPPSDYTFENVAALPNSKMKHATIPINVTFVPSVPNVHAQNQNNAITNLNQLSTGYSYRPKLSTRNSIQPNHYGVLYVQNPPTTNNLSPEIPANPVSVQVTYHAYITFYKYNGIMA